MTDHLDAYGDDAGLELELIIPAEEYQKAVDWQEKMRTLEPSAWPSYFSDLLEDFIAVFPLIKQEREHNGLGINYLARHPLTRLYMEQLAVMAQVGPHKLDKYRQAYGIALKRAAGV